MDFLRDQIWQFWGAVIGALALLITILFFMLQRKNKKLSYSILAETPLLSVDEEIRGQIKIKYGRKNIQNIHLVLLKIQNKGNVDIASTDYEKPVTFAFAGSEILSIEVVDVSPKNLNPAITNEPSQFTIDPILLNKKDYIVVKLLFSNYESKITADSRILGVKEVERSYGVDDKISLRRSLTEVAVIAGFLLISIGINAVGSIFASQTLVWWEWVTLPFLLLPVLVVIYVLYQIVRRIVSE